MRFVEFPVSVLCSIFGLMVMFSLRWNEYGWMSEILERPADLPIDQNSILKSLIVLAISAGISVLNVRILRQGVGAFRTVVAVVMLFGVALALWSFFLG